MAAGREDDLREFMRELTLRSERAFVGFMATLDRHDRHTEAMTASLREHDARMNREHHDMIEEMREQRQALFRILDRLDGKGGTAPAT